MSERFYCTTCGRQRPIEEQREVEVKRNRGYAKIKRCATCVERSKMSVKEREAASAKDRKEETAAKKYAKDSSVEAPDV